MEEQSKKRSVIKKIALVTLPFLFSGMLLGGYVGKQIAQKPQIQVEQVEPARGKQENPELKALETLCEYHQITKKIVDRVKRTTETPHIKTILENMLAEATKYEEYFKEASEITGLDSDLIKAYITVESGHTRLSHHAVSTKGAIGIAQMLLPAAKETGTIKIIYTKQGEILYDERRDPRKAIIGSAKYLKKYIDFYKDLILGLASYNIGTGTMDKLLNKKNTDIFTILFKNIPETRVYTLEVIARTLILKGLEKYELNIGQKPSYEEQRRASEKYVASKEESIYKILPKPTNIEIETIKYLNPAIIDLKCIPKGVTVYLPERNYEAKKTNWRK